MEKDTKSVSTQPDASRRRFFIGAGSAIGAAAVINLLPRSARADDLPHLSTSDPTAQALTYTEDASTTKAPTHVAGAACANCNFFQGAAAAWGPCQLFPGKAVNAKGWCAGYAKKA